MLVHILLIQSLVLTPYITHIKYGHIVISGQNHAGYGISGSVDQPDGAGKIGVLTPHLNYISGKAAVIVTTGDATISEGSYVLSYPLGVSYSFIECFRCRSLGLYIRNWATAMAYYTHYSWCLYSRTLILVSRTIWHNI